MPRVTTKVEKKKLGVIERLLKVSQDLKKPLGAKLVLPLEGDTSLENLSWVLYQEYGVNHTYTITPKEANALSFPHSPGFVPKERGKRKLESVGGGSEPNDLFAARPGPITNLNVSQPSDIFAGRAAVQSVEHHGFPAQHFIRDTLAEKRHGVESIKLQIGDEIIPVGRKAGKTFNPQSIGKILISYIKDIKEAIAEKIEVLMPQTRFDDGRLFGEQPADVFRARAKVVGAARGEDIIVPLDPNSLEGFDLRRKHPLISRMRFTSKRRKRIK